MAGLGRISSIAAGMVVVTGTLIVCSVRMILGG